MLKAFAQILIHYDYIGIKLSVLQIRKVSKIIAILRKKNLVVGDHFVSEDALFQSRHIIDKGKFKLEKQNYHFCFISDFSFLSHNTCLFVGLLNLQP